MDGRGRGWVELRVSGWESAARLVEQGGDGRGVLGHEAGGQDLAVVWEQSGGGQGA